MTTALTRRHLLTAALAAGAAAPLAGIGRATATTPGPPRLNLPRPTGPYRLGTVSLHLVDTSRPDPVAGPGHYRELMASVWYPAAPDGRRCPTAPWLETAPMRALLAANGFAADAAVAPFTSTVRTGRYHARTLTDIDDRRGGRLVSDVPHTARIWNYWLGGKDNFAADRAIGDQVQQFLPDIVTSARADRAFLKRAVRYLVAEAGIRQFLDIGTGLPTADNTHEVAQSLAPQARIVYADNDPLVLVHARALLTSTPEGATDYIDADARDTDKILKAAATTLDFGSPVAVMLLGVLNFIGDDEEADGIVRRLIGAVPSGSYLAIAHPTTEIKPEESAAAARQWNQTAKPPIALRRKADLLRWFEGLDLLEPGVVTCTKWRPEPGDPTAGTDVYQFCGLARKP